MSYADILRGASLWDEEEVARHALRWAESAEASGLLQLPPSQFAALVRSTSRASTAEGFLTDLTAFIDKRKSRRKSRSVWHRLAEALPAALAEAKASGLESNHEANEIFEICHGIAAQKSGEKGVEGLKADRELKVMRAFVTALAQRYRARALYEEIDENE